MEKELEQKSMHFNATTPHISPHDPRAGPPVYGVLIAFLLLTLLGCVAAMAVYIRRKTRLDELRHRLIPLYTYDSIEQDEDWGNDGREEDKEMTEPLCEHGKLSFTTG
ncbi:uncharacterized protein C3orf18 homolog [Polymixia lowei]